jgi:hypothetical protein
MNSGGPRREQNRAPNERNISPSEMKRNRKSLKSLGAKSRDFAESFVFNGLTGFSFRRFSTKPLRQRNTLRPAIFRAADYNRYF